MTYHGVWRAAKCCCICRAGEMERGGLAAERALGSTMGMALRVRWAMGWCSFMWWGCGKPVGDGLKVLGAVESRKEGVGCAWSCSGELSGDPEDMEPRSDPEEEWMDCRSSSVRRLNGLERMYQYVWRGSETGVARNSPELRVILPVKAHGSL